MKIKTLTKVVNGASIGSVIDLAKKDAERLIKQGVAEEVVEKGTSEPKKTAKKKLSPKKTEEKKDESKIDK